MPIYGHTNFGHNSTVFWPILIYQYIIYRLVTRNHDSLAYLQILFFMDLSCDSRKDARKLINQFFMSQHIGFNASGIQSALIY